MAEKLISNRLQKNNYFFRKKVLRCETFKGFQAYYATMNRALKLSLCVAIPLAIGVIGATATQSGIDDWYAMLNKPAFNPPNDLFGPVWGMLYIFMGISFCRVLNQPNSSKRTWAIIIFGVQLILNFWWSFLFFAWHLIDIAFFEIIGIWISVLLMIILFLRIDRVAAVMQIPYLLWISFAALLNGAIWQLNS